MRKLARLFLTFSLLAGTWTFVHAQTAAYAEIVQVNADDFPRISTLVDIYDANGNFISGVQPSDITVYEDAQETKADKVAESEVPVQMVVAINPGPGMAVRDTNGIPRFDRVTEALTVSSAMDKVCKFGVELRRSGLK